MKRITYLILCFLLISIESFAVPALKRRVQITLEDGRQVMATLTGDEFFHYYITDDGQMVKKQPSGLYRLITKQEADLTKSKARSKMARRDAVSRQFAPKTLSEEDTKRRGLVILAQFQDLKFSSDSVPAYLNRQFNEIGFSEGNNSGSVHDYFYDQSYGKFDLAFDVVGPVTLNHPLEYYGGNDSNGSDLRPKEFAAEACLAVQDSVDFSQYDWDGDGVVDLVFLVFAGYSEAQWGPDESIWPHMWAIYDQELIIDGVRVYTYACTSELRGCTGADIDGIGTACHEFGHCFGLPDIYDIYYSPDTKTMGNLDIMDSGSYLGRPISTSPVGYTALERFICGWTDLVLLDQKDRIRDMKPLEDAPVAYCMVNNNNNDEFFTIENRTFKKWGVELVGNGLLVTHVDYDQEAWQNNEVNTDPDRPRVLYVPSNGYYDYSYYCEDILYPGYYGIPYLLTDERNPIAQLHTPNTDNSYNLNLHLQSIEMAADSTVSFTVGYAFPDPPANIICTNHGDKTIECQWDEVADADHYEVMFTSPVRSNLYNESFTDIPLEDGTEINYYNETYVFSSNEFSYDQAYASTKGLRIGADDKIGYLMCPIMTPYDKSSFTLVVRMEPFKEETPAHLLLYKYKEEKDTISTVVSKDSMFVFNFDGWSGTDRICIDLDENDMVCIKNLQIFEGHYTAEDLMWNGTDDMPMPEYSYDADTITTTTPSYTFTEFPVDKKYWIKVKTHLADGRQSLWSDYVSAGNPTAIQTIPSTPSGSQPSEVYDLTGRRVATWSAPGIYIRNGKKFVVSGNSKR